MRKKIIIISLLLIIVVYKNLLGEQENNRYWDPITYSTFSDNFPYISKSKKIIEIFNQNVFPTLMISILSCLISFKTQMIEDFLVSNLIESENVDSKENEIINSYWKDDKR